MPNKDHYRVVRPELNFDEDLTRGIDQGEYSASYGREK